jgi:DNA-binding MarR family transcriptional regulator
MARHVRGTAPDLTSRQMALMLEIYLNDQRLHTVRELAATLNLSKPVVTRALDAMTRHGFVRRKRDEMDRRNVYLHRTVKGSTYLAEFADVILEAEQAVDAAPGPDAAQ